MSLMKTGSARFVPPVTLVMKCIISSSVHSRVGVSFSSDVSIQFVPFKLAVCNGLCPIDTLIFCVFLAYSLQVLSVYHTGYPS